MMLEVRDLHAFYGKSHILQGVDLTVDQGEIVSLLGRNGVGRSTACKTIMGLVPPVGQISFKGRAIAGLRPDQIHGGWKGQRLNDSRRCRSGGHGDSQIEISRLQRRREVFLNAVGFAVHVARHHDTPGNGLEGQVRRYLGLSVQRHDGQHSRHERALIHRRRTAALRHSIGWSRRTSAHRN